jgi:hypothetical protein
MHARKNTRSLPSHAKFTNAHAQFFCANHRHARMDLDEKQILVKFVSKLPAELRVSEAPVAVPTTLKRYGLSQIINHLLGLGDNSLQIPSLPLV